MIKKVSGENFSGSKLPGGAFITPRRSKRQKILWLQRPFNANASDYFAQAVDAATKAKGSPIYRAGGKANLGVQGFESESPSVADGIPPRWVVNGAPGHSTQDNLIAWANEAGSQKPGAVLL